MINANDLLEATQCLVEEEQPAAPSGKFGREDLDDAVTKELKPLEQ